MRRVTLTLIVISFLCIININLVFSEAPQSKEMPGDFGDSCDTGGVFDLTGVSCDESCNGQTNTCPDGHTQTCSCYMCVGACMDDLGCGIDPICGFCSSGTCTGEGELYGCTWGSCTGPTQTFCGDGTIQSPNDYGTYEDCEGINLNGASCVSLGYDSGTLSCTSLTCTFDESGCSYDSSEDCTDGVDNDADGDVDCDDSDCSGDASCPCTDNDGDGACAEDYDCDDTNADISPYETEICNDGLDNDCDSYIDCQDRYCSSDITCTCEDADSDGYYAIEDSCYEGLDCDDTNITINPSAIELCVDLIDNDCDNSTGGLDMDSSTGIDCDDTECNDPSYVCSSCTGASNFAYNDSSDVCRASAGTCDTADTCTGSSSTCPADAKSSAECRASAGDCDVAETCDGASDDCPVDAYQSTSTSCTYSSCASTCDGAGSCTSASCSCFPAGTKVLMADGSKKNIEKVKVGEIVLSYDVELMKFAKSKVLELESPIREGYYIIEFEDGTELKITNEHPVWVRG